MFKMEIRGFRCNDDTEEIGSDEIGFFLAALPVIPANDPASYRYTDELSQEFRIRWATEINTGSVSPFQYPIGVKNNASGDGGLMLQIILIMFEIDGPSTTKNQAIGHHNKWREKIESDCRPGVNVESVWRRIMPDQGFDGGGFAGSDEIVALDSWFVYMFNPLRGAVDFGDERLFWNPTNAAQSLQSRLGITAALYKNRRDDGSLSETRSYQSSPEESRYTFEVEYTDA